MGLIREMFVSGQYMAARTPEEIAELNKRELARIKYEDERDEAFFEFFRKIGRLSK
jgi:hypothetical protein